MTEFRIFELSAHFKSGLTGFSLARNVFQNDAMRFKELLGGCIACQLTATRFSLRSLHDPVAYSFGLCGWFKAFPACFPSRFVPNVFFSRVRPP